MQEQNNFFADKVANSIKYAFQIFQKLILVIFGQSKINYYGPLLSRSDMYKFYEARSSKANNSKANFVIKLIPVTFIALHL